MAAHIARRDAHARIVTNPFDLVRMGHGVEIQRAAIFDEPEWRAHSLSVSAIALQVQILSVGELSELVIAHNFTKRFCSTVAYAPRTAPISLSASVAKREEVQPGADVGD